MMKITEDDLIVAVREAMHTFGHAQVGMTTKEIAHSLGKSPVRTLELLRPLVERGELIAVKTKRRAIDGRDSVIGAWVLKAKVAPAKRRR